MFKITLCLTFLLAYALAENSQRFATAEEYQAHLRTLPYFFHGTWQVVNPVTPVNLHRDTTICIPTSTITFAEGNKDDEYTISLSGDNVVGYNCKSTIDHLILPYPNASSYDQALNLKQVNTGKGQYYQIDGLNVTMDTVEGAFHVKFRFMGVTAGRSPWTTVTLSKRVPIESLVEVYPISNTSPGFFLGNWTITQPYSHAVLADQDCCVPQGKANVWGNATISPYKIFMNATSWVGKKCDGVLIGGYYSYSTPVTLAVPFPAVSSYETIASSKDWHYNFRGFGFKVKDLKVNTTFADNSTHESFSLQFGFLNGRDYIIDSCSVTFQRRVGIFDKDILKGIKGTFLEK